MKGNNPESRLINKMLDTVMEEIDTSYNSLLADQGYVHPQQIKEAILNKRDGKLTRKEEELKNKKNFFDYFDEVNAIKKMEVSKKNALQIPDHKRKICRVLHKSNQEETTAD